MRLLNAAAMLARFVTAVQKSWPSPHFVDRYLMPELSP
jgi:hypothetical protein